MVANVTISQNPKKKKKIGINLKYNKNLFSLKIHFPKKLLIFASVETENYEWIFVIENLRPKDCEISPGRNKKKSVAANCYKP